MNVKLQQWKDRIAKDTHGKKWAELDNKQQWDIIAKHRLQFYTLAHGKRKRTI
jgi:hypothetical protein